MIRRSCGPPGHAPKSQVREAYQKSLRSSSVTPTADSTSQPGISESDGAVQIGYLGQGISWPPPMTGKARELLSPVRQIPVCRSVRPPPQISSLMGCRAGNRSSHRRSSQARNDLPEWENTDHPVTRSTLYNILAANSGRKGGYGPPATNQFEGTGVVLGAQATRNILSILGEGPRLCTKPQICKSSGTIRRTLFRRREYERGSAVRGLKPQVRAPFLL